MELYGEVKASERLPEDDSEPIVIMKDGSVQHEPFKKGLGWWTEYYIPGHDEVDVWLEPIEITEEEIGSLYKVIKIAEEERFSCGVDDDPDVFNAYILLRKLTGIDGDLSKLKK
ncbi:MAG TPA: hypothetical protein ENH85_02150 [Candidatus Scalindua sp.]|nr:hypothetical protein [Candidatus Scalindua sp.]